MKLFGLEFSIKKEQKESKPLIRTLDLEPKTEETQAIAVVEEPKPVDIKVNEQKVEFEKFNEKYGEMVRDIYRLENQKYANIVAQSEKPVVSAGRVSMYEGFRSMLPNENSPIPSNFDFKLLGLMRNLSMWNPHFSMATENIVTLGNTDYDINFGDGVTDFASKKYRKFLNEKVQNWYEFADGEDSLDNDLLAQICHSGAISAENCILPNMRGIQNVVRVDPENIRFGYDAQRNVHIPLQQVGWTINQGMSQKYPGYIQLNPNTYSYIARMRQGESPYAIPPFLSAIESVFTENDMIKNFQNMMKRLGMMGFLSVVVNTPEARSGESVEAYQARLSQYLESIRQPIEHGFSRGVVIGFKDTHDFEVHAPMNPAAAEQAMNMIQSLVFTGLKQDPNMHGKNEAVSEAFGRVLLEKLTLQVGNWQKVLGTFKARAFKLELALNGIFVKDLIVKYKPAATADEKRKEEIGGLRRLNLQMDFNQNLISQDQFAQLLGYDKPAGPEPRVSDALKVAEMKIKAGIKDEPPTGGK